MRLIVERLLNINVLSSVGRHRGGSGQDHINDVSGGGGKVVH